MTTPIPPPGYKSWSHDDLIRRVADLEAELRFRSSDCTPRSNTSSSSAPPQPVKKPKKQPTPFDSTKYGTRLIALKFAYLGGRYNGFEHHSNNTTPLPTVEEELWKALKKTRLIFPLPRREDGVEREMGEDDVCWDGCDYSKCGRTDRGVSAFGQVIGLRVRSNRPPDKRKTERSDTFANDTNGATDTRAEGAGLAESTSDETTPSDGSDATAVRMFDDVRDELPYPQLLNRVLPPDMRITAWCPHPPENFSARFDCKERRYRYFFTNPAFAPRAGRREGADSGWLDVGCMQEAAKKLEGLHDFRNFCKLDPGKQISNFERRVFHASVHRVERDEELGSYVGGKAFRPGNSLGVNSMAPNGVPGYSHTPQLYYFEVHGSAFLWHQVRHLIATIFLVGQGLEQPTVIDELLDVRNNPTKPKYEMASDTPLVLWDCIFPEAGAAPEQLAEGRVGHRDSLDWLYIGVEGAGKVSMRPGTSAADLKWGRKGLMDNMWALWRQKRMDEVLAGSLMDLVASQGPPPDDANGLVGATLTQDSARVFDGHDAPRSVGKYVSLMERERMEAVEVVNARYARRKGLNGQARARADGEVDE